MLEIIEYLLKNKDQETEEGVVVICEKYANTGLYDAVKKLHDKYINHKVLPS